MHDAKNASCHVLSRDFKKMLKCKTLTKIKKGEKIWFYQLMLILIFVQFIPHKEQISFQIKNLGLSLPCPFVSVVPKLHQRFSVFILQGAIILQRLAASQQFLTLCRQSLLILLSELLQSSRIHSRFILLQKKKTITKNFNIDFQN